MDWIRENLPYIAFFGGLSILTWMMLRRVWAKQRKSKKETSNEPLVHVPYTDDRPFTMSGGPNDLQRWQAEMLTITRQFQAELNTKIHYLQQAMTLAERDAERLQSLIEAAQAEGIKTDNVAVDRLRQAMEEAAKFDADAAPDFGVVTETLCDVKKKNELYAMSDDGKSVEEIAVAMEMDPVAVEMVLSMRG
ncbi:hypothetical protein LOC68_18210 [Blastopirellula sp. JC732]|uniref:DUF2802 domain-containing protein n=1 Tax=Blastopirellula sediminis TaxID=2894196 RepID=A0A9X1MN88_9BACT|nr:hypothetical protein [Blastopirellula sediminis]MCC9606369.1 hypothetical protein [Blastopirellula sediminis]MCC9630333.1 hypothetical protein [Blastopirellula sediminis]